MARLAFAALALASLASCLGPVADPVGFDSMSAVREGDTKADVVKALGYPDATASGAWVGYNRYSMRHEVWYYGPTDKSKKARPQAGRVIFDRDSDTVAASEADAQEDGRP
jgi:hypothetical protein